MVFFGLNSFLSWLEGEKSSVYAGCFGEVVGNFGGVTCYVIFSFVLVFEGLVGFDCLCFLNIRSW